MFSIVVQKLNFVVFVVASQIYSWHYLFNYFNCNTKVPSIGKTETEIENGEDITAWAKQHLSFSPVAASQLVLCATSDNVPARTKFLTYRGILLCLLLALATFCIIIDASTSIAK